MRSDGRPRSERRLEEMLEIAGLRFTRPENDARDPTDLDYFLPDVGGGLYVEAKDYHTPRITDQLALLPKDARAIVLIGRHSVEGLLELVRMTLPRLEGDHVDKARALLRIIQWVHPRPPADLAEALLTAGLLAKMTTAPDAREASAQAGTFIDEVATNLGEGG